MPRWRSRHRIVHTSGELHGEARPQAARGGGPGRRRRAKHVPIAGGAAPPGGHGLTAREYVPVELLPELPPFGAGALPEHGPVTEPALCPAARPGGRAGAGAVPEHGPLLGPAPRPRRGRVQRGAPHALAPRGTAGRAAEDVGEVHVGPARRRAGAGHGDACGRAEDGRAGGGRGGFVAGSVAGNFAWLRFLQRRLTPTSASAARS